MECWNIWISKIPMTEYGIQNIGQVFFEISSSPLFHYSSFPKLHSSILPAFFMLRSFYRMGQCKDVDPFCPAGQEHSGTFIHGCSCRINIVHQQEGFPLQVFWSNILKGVSHRLFPICATQIHLRGRGIPLLQKSLPVRDSGSAAQFLHQEEGLIEASFPEPPGVKRNGNQKVKEGRVPVTMRPCCHPLPERTGQGGLPLIFPAMDHLLQRAHIIPQGPGRFIMSRLRQAIAAGMGFADAGGKGAPTD